MKKTSEVIIVWSIVIWISLVIVIILTVPDNCYYIERSFLKEEHNMTVQINYFKLIPHSVKNELLMIVTIVIISLTLFAVIVIEYSD